MRPGPVEVGDTAIEPFRSELARFFGYSHDILTIMDESSRILMISPSARRILGEPIESLIGSRLLRRLHPEDRALARTRAAEVFDGQPLVHLDVRLRNGRGDWVPMRWSLSVGPKRRIYAVGRDRTVEAHHQQAKLRQERAELRLRTTMELHDGILQTLTAASLQIAVARKLLESDPGAAQDILQSLGDTVVAEQREIRLYVDEVTGRASAWTDENLTLSERIQTIIRRVGMVWGLETKVDTRVDLEVHSELARQVLRIIQEATVNATRHGSAESVSITVEMEDRTIILTIVDDGAGFSFKGSFDDETLRRERLGPLSLKHRVQEAGGRISIDSTAHGATVVVRIPMDAEEDE